MHSLFRNKIGLMFLFIMVMGHSGFGQKFLQSYDYKPIHFGFQVGLNSSTFRVWESEKILRNDSLLTFTPQGNPGIQLGIVSDVRLGEHGSLRFIPSLMFSERHLAYDFDKSKYNATKRVESAFVYMPLYLKLRSDRINNYRLYVLNGFKYGIDMSSKEKVIEDFEKVKIYRHDYTYELGFGIDFYLQYFKFSPEISVSTGLRNLLVPETHQYSTVVESLKSRTIMLTFNFE